MMVTTSFLSLWINNSPTAVMMLPIAKSVATEYLKQFSMKKPIDKHELQINEDGESLNTRTLQITMIVR